MGLQNVGVMQSILKRKMTMGEMISVGADSTWITQVPQWVKDSGTSFEIVSDVRNWTPKEGTFKVFIDFNEPDFYLPCTEENVLPVAHEFDLILSRRPNLIALPG